MTIDRTNIIDHDEPLSTMGPPELCSAPGQRDGWFCAERATWRRSYVGGTVAYFCQRHADEERVLLERDPSAERDDGRAPSARELAFRVWADTPGGGAPGPHRGHLAASRTDWDAGADYGLAIAAQLAEALESYTPVFEDAELRRLGVPFPLARDLAARYQHGQQALAAYRAALGKPS